MTVLTATSLAIGYGTRTVAQGINLSLPAGSVTCLLGPNGVGKTTLFKTCLGLIAPLSGSLTCGGRDLSCLSRPEIARQMAYVPQSIAGPFTYTVLDLVVMGRTSYLGAFGTPAKADFEIARDALRTVGIEPLANADTDHISGGQRQLALIARALAQRSRLIVMDEPTASLDFGNRLLVMERIRTLAREGLAVLFSTHDPEHAFAIADHVVALGRDGYFAAGTAEAELTSENLTRLFGVALTIEKTPSGRRVVSPAQDDIHM
jgi:iron complex transport system ATP-binding protein